MFKYKGIFFLITLFILISLTIIFISIDKDFRRNLFNKFVNGYTLYQTFKMSKNVYDRDFENASKQIINYINFSQKISKGKNSMLKGIFQVTELISSKAYTQENYNDMQIVYEKINEITDDIYQNHIWLARSLADDDLDKSMFHFNKAIKLASSNENAYREIVKLFYKNKNYKNLINKYCTNYFSDLGGGVTKNEGFLYDEKKFFYGSSSEFAITTNESGERLYTQFISDNGKYINYKFILDGNENINNITIYKNFFPGSKISIKNFILYNNDNFEINFNEIVVYGLSSYILNQSKNEIIVIKANDSSEVIKIDLINTYKNINKISFNLKIDRLPIISQNICNNKNEN